MVHFEEKELPEKKANPGDSLTDNSRAENRLRDTIGGPETRGAFGGESWLPPVPTAPRIAAMAGDQPPEGKMEGNSGQPPEEVRKPEPANTPKEKPSIPPEASSEGSDPARQQTAPSAAPKQPESPPPPSVTPRENVARDADGRSLETTSRPGNKPPSPLEQQLKEIQTQGEQKVAREQAQAAQPVLDENNRGMEAWHDAMRERNALTASERRMEAGNQVNNKIDGLRDGKFPDGTQRQFPPEDAPVAAYAKEKALEKSIETPTSPSRTPRDESPSPTPGKKNSSGYKGNPDDRDASLGNSIDV